ncbi:MAG: hypothetical protein BLM47_01865 [Candidatus Reconcilbacillus cellulovorans]|uniref:DNA-binding response regulator n=1 Tax=Candidatus Reconcilbacillus cellulovorans TaxID=1906605 RepID=A0A2A6E3W9_9BACL|nr:MAG: hypothetical protein BLM47_01865 [Candidatus Reconcilbacillus cellulovorans]
MKLVICDDEPIERLALRRIVEQHVPGVEVAAEAANGRQAIALADEHRPDLMTVDIKMPGIDGLAAIREIRGRHPRVRFILVSAYDTFEYAQEAIRLGVTDYILKPSSPTDIAESIRRAAEAVERERQREEERWRLLDRIGRLSPLAERQLVADLLAGRPPSEVADVFEPGEEGYALAVCLEPEPSPLQAEKAIATLKAWNSVWTGCFAAGIMPVVVRRTASRAVAVGASADAASADGSIAAVAAIVAVAADAAVAVRAAGDLQDAVGTAAHRDARAEALTDLAARLRKALPGFSVRLTAGRIVRDPAELPLSFGDAVVLARRRVFHGETVLVASEGGVATDENGPVAPMLRMIGAIRAGDEAEALHSCADAFAEWQGKAGLTARDAFVALAAVLVHAFGDAAALPPFGSSADINAWRAAVEQSIRRLSRLGGAKVESGAGREARLRAFAESAMNYIREHYADDVRLEEAAGRFGLSPSHFCRLFREACGGTFVGALTRVRIEAARRELERGRSVKETAYAVGYRDPDYFARIFRRTVGVSPAHYAKTAKKDG